MRSVPPPKRFVEWCRQGMSPPADQLSLREFLDEERKKDLQGWNQETLTDQFFETINKNLREGKASAVAINHHLPAKEYKISGKRNDYEGVLTHLEMSVQPRGGLTIENVSIGHWRITKLGVAMDIKNNNIATLYVPEGIHAHLTIENTNIGTIKVEHNAVAHLDMRGGCILNLECPPPGTENPFTGSVSLSNVFLPRCTEKYLLEGPQPYRNLRYHLRSLENAQTANLVHAAELAVERKTDTKTNKLLSMLYELFSDFGSSTLRPLVWLGALLVFSALIIYTRDGAVLTDQMYAGWQSVLQEQNHEGRVLRSAVMALEPVISPLSIFTSKALLVPKDVWMAIWSGFQRIFSVIFIALFVLAVRRRFKMQ